MIRSGRLLGALAMALAVLPASALGATRLGPDLTSPPMPSGGFGFVAIGCQASYPSCSFVNLRSTNPGATFAAPAAGVITSWSFRAGMGPQAEASAMTLKTYRPGTQDGTSGYSFATAVNTGPTFEIPAGNQLPSDPPTVLPARMPIAAGERVGITADNDITFAVYNPTDNVSSTVLFTGFPPYNGEDYGTTYGGTAIAINALVEPDADGDGYGDETQDCYPTDPARYGCDQVVNPPPFISPPIVDPGGGCSVGCGGGAVFSQPPSQPPAGDPSRVYVELKCPAGATAPCGGFLLVTTSGQGSPRTSAGQLAAPVPAAKIKTLARADYMVDPGRSERITLKLSKAGKKLLKRKGRLKVTVTIQPNSGDPVSVKRTLKAR